MTYLQDNSILLTHYRLVIPPMNQSLHTIIVKMENIVIFNLNLLFSHSKARYYYNYTLEWLFGSGGSVAPYTSWIGLIKTSQSGILGIEGVDFVGQCSMFSVGNFNPCLKRTFSNLPIPSF